MVNANKYLYLIFAGAGFIFLRSGFGKVTGGIFVSTLEGTLGKFASENPHPLVKSFLEFVAIPNSFMFGNLTMWGEVLVGVNLLVLSSYLLFAPKIKKPSYLLLAVGLFFAILLNLTFWLSAGWMSSSTESLNLLMLYVEAVGLWFALQKFAGKET